MKIYVSADMEGVSGVVHREHTTPVGVDYDLARRLMTAEVNAAVEAAREAGGTEVVVSDSHGGNQFRSILASDIHPEAQLITGGPRLHGQMEGLDGSFAHVVLLGYHVRHGAFGVLDHTTHGQAISRVTVNGQEMGEIGLNAGLAGHFGVPVGAVTGDDRTIAEARTLLPWIHGAVVKWALGRYSARCLAPAKAHAVIKEAVAAAMRDRASLRPFRVTPPVTIHVRFKDSGTAQKVQTVPGVSAVDDVTVAVTGADYPTAFKAYSALVDLWEPAWGSWQRTRA